MYKIYEDCIKVYKSGKVEYLNDEKVNPRIQMIENKNLGRKRADLIFNDPKKNYKRKAHSFLKVLGTLFLDLPKDKFFVFYPKDNDFSNYTLDNIIAVPQSEITRESYRKNTKFKCTKCQSLTNITPRNKEKSHVKLELCTKCYHNHLNQQKFKKIKLNEIKKEFEKIDLENTALTENQIEILNLRLQGKTLQEIGERFNVTREYIRLRLKTIKELGEYPQIKCKECGNKCYTKTVNQYLKTLKNQVCKNCK